MLDLPARRTRRNGSARSDVNWGRLRRRCRPRVCLFEDRTLLSAPSADPLAAVAIPIALGTPKTGTLSANEVVFFQISPTTDGRLIAQVDAPGCTTRLTLMDSQGQVLLTSDGQSPTNQDDQIELYVPAGTDFLEVQNLEGSGTYVLTTSLSPSAPPLQPIPINPDGSEPVALVTGDFTGDGRTDLAVANFGSNDVSILLGNGDGAFQNQGTDAVGSSPYALVTGDFTGDGRTDLAVANFLSNDVSILLGNGDGTFTDPGQFATTPHSTPLVADVNGDGTEDVLVVDGAGNILYRQGIPGQPGTFEPPVTINPGTPSRDIAWVPDTNQGPVLASVDAHDNAISLYAYRDGGFVKVGSLATGFLPAQIIAADLNGDGLTDLVVRNAGDGTLSVFYNNGIGSLQAGLLPFLRPVTLPVGLGVSDVQAVDTTGSGRLDLVVTNKLSGQVSVPHNQGDGSFTAPVPYRAGTGLSAIDPGSTPEVTSLEATAGVAAGPLTTGGPTDLVTINPGSYTLDVLAGLGGGRFANPVTIQTASPAQVVRMGDFTGNGIDDLAVLTTSGVSIYLGNGKGGFLSPVTYAVGPESDGLTLADLTGNGKLDLLVGDAYGDVLVLLGKGDGSFQPYHEADQAITLAVADLTGNGSKDVIYADQGLDRVVVDYGAGGSAVLGDQATGLLSPGAVKLADLNGDGIPDLIVANSGSNNVLIYPGLGNGQFGPAVNGGHGYFVGTNPVGITVAYLTGGLPDLVVADKGSNQVSILVNQSQPGGAISFDAGPRLNSGGTGPVSTVVGYFTPGSAYQDILVSNSGTNNVALLPGVGGVFFNDQNPQTFAVGTNPGPLFVGSFDGKPDLVTVNAGSNDLTLISDFMSADYVTSTISSGGTEPDAAFSFSTGSGFDNLVVGNGGDGVLALFEGSEQGLTLTYSETNPDLPSPTALAFSALTGGQIQFYAATAGREAATLVTLSLSDTTQPEAAALPSPSTNNLAQLVPLQQSSLAVVGTLLVTTIESPGAEVNLSAAETETTTALAFSLATPVSVGQGTPGQGGNDNAGGGGNEEAGTPADAAASRAGPDASSWQSFVLGTDEALEQFQREHQGLSPESGDANAGSAPPEVEHEWGSPGSVGPSDVKSSLFRLPGDPGQESSRATLRSRQAEAIDAVIGSLWDQDAGAAGGQWRRERDASVRLPGGLLRWIPATQVSLPHAIRLQGTPSPSADPAWADSLSGLSEPRTQIRSPAFRDPSQSQRIEVSVSMVLATMVAGWVYAGHADWKVGGRKRWAMAH